MNPVWMAVIAMFFYAITNLILEQKLSHCSVFAILTFSYILMLIISASIWGGMRLMGNEVIAPSGRLIGVAALMAFVYFVADALYTGAYTNKGSLLSVTTVVVIFPPIASIMKFFWIGDLPNKYQIFGYLLATAATIMVAKGNSI